MSEFAQILEAVTDLKTELKSDIAKLQTDVNKIKTVLAGDEFGTKGLVDNHNFIAEKLYKLRDDVRTYKVIGGVLYGIIGIIISILTYFSIKN